MSRCQLDDSKEGEEVVIGWDPGLQTFFAQVVESGADGPIVWLGTKPRQFETSNGVINQIKQYVVADIDWDAIEKELIEDKLSNSERMYSVFHGRFYFS